MGATFQPMTESEYYILLALLRPAHGYGMMHLISELSGGRMRIGPGTLYGVLTRMKKQGLIDLSAQDERRKTYLITDAGRDALLSEYARIKAMASDGAMLEDEL